MRSVANERDVAVRDHPRETMAGEQCKLLGFFLSGEAQYLPDGEAEVIILCQEGMKVERPAPANLILCFQRPENASSDLEIIVTKRAGKNIQSTAVFPKDRDKRNAVDVLDFGFADNGTIH